MTRPSDRVFLRVGSTTFEVAATQLTEPTPDGEWVDGTVVDMEELDVVDGNADPTGSRDSSSDIQLAADYAAANNKILRYPQGQFLHLAPTTMPVVVSIEGAGRSNTILNAPFDGPLFILDTIVSAGTNGNNRNFRGFEYIGPGQDLATNDAACFYLPSTSKGLTGCHFADITSRRANAFFKSDALPHDTGMSNNRFAGQVNWCAFDNIFLRNKMKYGFLFNQGSGTGNSFEGGKPFIGKDGGAFVEINGAPDTHNQGFGVNVGDLIFNDIHAATEGMDRTTAAFFRGGPGTTYRSCIAFNGCQFDARADHPLDLHWAPGEELWSEISQDGNNIGGAVDLFTKIPPLSRSRITGRGVSRWEDATRGGHNSETTTAQLAFRVHLADLSFTEFKVVVGGSFGAFGVATAGYEFSVRRGIGVPTIVVLSSYLNGNANTNLKVTGVPNGQYVDVYIESATSGAAASWSADIHTRAGTLRVQTGLLL